MVTLCVWACVYNTVVRKKRHQTVIGWVKGALSALHISVMFEF